MPHTHTTLSPVLQVICATYTHLYHLVYTCSIRLSVPYTHNSITWSIPVLSGYLYQTHTHKSTTWFYTCSIRLSVPDTHTPLSPGLSNPLCHTHTPLSPGLSGYLCHIHTPHPIKVSYNLLFCSCHISYHVFVCASVCICVHSCLHACACVCVYMIMCMCVCVCVCVCVLDI